MVKTLFQDGHAGFAIGDDFGDEAANLMDGTGIDFSPFLSST